jgi:transcriptional regulator with XRE-family HTH domain
VRVLTTGAQLRAARALAGITQAELAVRAKLNSSTIADMEARGQKRLRSSLETILAVSQVLESAGVEFLNGDSPGVRLKPSKG